MDPNLYFLKARNKYTVHFLNKKKLSVDDISNIFSEYGTVIEVTCSGNESGMRFVSYSTLTETLACIKGLQDSQNITLLCERTKLENNVNEDSANSVITSNIEKNKKCKRKRQRNKQESKSNNEDLLQHDNQSVISRQEADKKMMCNNTQNRNEYFENNEGSSTSSYGESAKLSIGSNIISKKDHKNHSGFNYIDSLLHSEKSFLENEQRDYETSLAGSKASKHLRSMESLNEIASYACSITEADSVLAQDVIVANVPEERSIFFILDMLHEFHPIAISLMRKIHKTGIQYCHVYFKNLQDALNAERRFDKTVTSAGPIIVLRSDNLLKEILMD